MYSISEHFLEDNRRLVVRGDIKQWNQMLAETAHNAGVITNEEFAIFQNAGYMGLYGGLDVEGIFGSSLSECVWWRCISVIRGKSS